MTGSRSAQEIFDEVQSQLGTVPSVDEDYCCPLCLGPVNLGFERCYACSQLAPQIPSALVSRVIPITSVLTPSPWYGRLREYKISRPEYMSTVAAVVHLYFQEHAKPIDDLLGGAPTIISVVPSTRGGDPLKQPLFRGLGRSSKLKDRLKVVQRHRGQAVGRWEYNPKAFPATGNLRGERVLVVEDLWVTGAKATSAAGALMAAGATVALLVVGREVNSTYTDEDHPYRAAMQRPYKIESWPR